MRESVSISGLSLGYSAIPVLEGIDLTVGAGEFLALLGPSGSGKTTLLRAIAGLERPDEGSIAIGDRTMADIDVWIPPERRGVGMVFQDGALFPHLSVGENVGFGLPRAERTKERIAGLLAMVDLAGFDRRLPGTLSGGQQQRVALARALAPSPSVLLLDEPFSALDAALRVQLRGEIRRILSDIGITVVFVTHDQDEAFVMGDRVAVLRDGRIEQVGTPSELYRRPSTPWVARFVGEANLLAGRAEGRQATTEIGPIPISNDAEGSVQVLVRPEHLELHPGGDAEITSVEYYGHDARYELTFASGVKLAARDTDLTIRERGDHVSVAYVGDDAPAWSV